MKAKVGMIVGLESGPVEVIEVRDSYCTVKSLSQKVSDFETIDGEQVSFTKGGRTYRVSTEISDYLITNLKDYLTEPLDLR